MGTITVMIIIRNLEIGNNSISIKYRIKTQQTIVIIKTIVNLKIILLIVTIIIIRILIAERLRKYNGISNKNNNSSNKNYLEGK